MTFSVSKDDLNVQTLSIKAKEYIGKLIQAIKQVQNDEDSNTADLISYVWSYEAKDVVILLRDAILNLAKLEQYKVDGLRTNEEVETYKSKLQNSIHEASYYLLNSHSQKINGIGYRDQDWEHQENPSTAIIKQLQTLEDQIKKIQRGQHKLDRLNSKFSDFKESYRDCMYQRSTRVAGIHQSLTDIKDSPYLQQEVLEEKEITELVAKIQSVINALETQGTFASYDNIVLEDIDKLNIPVQSDGGQLQYKTVEVLSEVSGWASIHLTSPLKLVDAKIHSFTEQTISSLFQIMNRLKVKLEAGKENPEVKAINVITSLERIIKECKNELVPETVDKMKAIKADLNETITCSQLYSTVHNFLPVSSLIQMAGLGEKSILERRYSWANIKDQAQKLGKKIFSKYTEEEQLTAAGYISQVISFNSESDANALFLRKGYLGSSFTIERTEIINKIKAHYDLWSQGFGGSLLIAGGHGTGRSTILEIIPNLYPEIESHHLVIGQKLEINGYQSTVGHDLIKAVNFIIKYGGNKRCIITIDDLEFFSNTPEITYDTFQALLKIIRRHNKRIYFALTMHKYLKSQLAHYFDFSNPFSEVISTDHMRSDKIQEAVLTRAYAVSSQQEIAKSGDQFSTLARKVASKARNNIGRAMQLWCMYNGAYVNDNGNARFVSTVLKNEELIKVLFRNGPTYEPYLRSMLNEVDAAKMKSDIQSLTRIKLLHRPSDGYVRVNPYLQSTIEAIIN